MVYVISNTGKKLMPTTPVNARILLKQKKAKVKTLFPFTIRLLYDTTEYTQPVIVGIDDGDTVGIAAVADKKTIFAGELKLRKEISKLIEARSGLRRNRRYRLRYRQKRFDNRAASRGSCKVCGGNTATSKEICRGCLKEGNHYQYRNIKKSVFRVPPSIKARKNAIINCVKKLPFPVSKIRIEEAYFDIQAMENPNISGEEYQQGPQLYHKNYKSACLTRDDHKCRKCNSEKNLEVHHVKQKAHGGTDRLDNLMTLCSACHKSLHAGIIKLPAHSKAKSYKSAAHVQQGKNYLYHSLSEIAKKESTFGYVTSFFRKKAGLPKEHFMDAVIIANPKAEFNLDTVHTIFHIRKQNRALHKANPHKIKGKKNHNRERQCQNVITRDGYRKNDVVFYNGKYWYMSGFASLGRVYLKDADGEYLKGRTGKKGTISVKKISRKYGNSGSLLFLRRKYSLDTAGFIDTRSEDDFIREKPVEVRKRVYDLLFPDFTDNQPVLSDNAGIIRKSKSRKNTPNENQMNLF